MPTTFSLNPSMLCALKSVFCETGPNSIWAMFSKRTTLFFTFL